MRRQGTHATAVTYGYWSDLETDGYEWVFRPDACSGVIPTNDGQACVFASARPTRIGRGGVDVIEQIVAEGAPELAERLRRATPPDAARARGAATPATSASRTARAGRSSATPATSRIRSAPTASPTPCATPSCSPAP